MSDLVNVLSNNLLKKVPYKVQLCEVEKFNQDKLTIDVLPEGEKAKVLGVRLQATAAADNDKGFWYVPSIGSKVAVVFFDKEEAVLIQANQLDKLVIKGENGFEACFDLKNNKTSFNANEIIFNNGELGGLVKGTELQAQINRLNDIVMTLFNIIVSVPIIEAGNGSPSAFQQALSVALQGKTPANFSNILNDKITQ